MSGVRWGERAISFLWCVRKMNAHIDFDDQKRF